MAFNYSPLNKTATNLITKFGQAVTFSRYARGEYSPNTGAFSSNVGQTYTAQVVILDQPKSEVEETSTLTVENDALCSSATEPTIGDTATINSDKFRITAVKKIQPASTVVFYELRIAS
tara:strand:+ start:1264 stop:1620 length:357 start_codon:yes stop_codon:yes gene_type:complete